MRKKSEILVLILVVSLLLTACGAAEEKVVTDVDQAENVVEEGKTTTTTTTPKDGVALGSYEDGAENLSVEFVFDKEKLRVSDEDSNARSRVTLELITDVSSNLEMSCVLATVQELYDETMEGYVGDEWILSEMTESTIADMPIYYFSVKHELDDSISDAYFILDAGNGLCLYNGECNGYEGNESLENMISYAFLEVKQGDGTIYRPQLPFSVDTDGNVLTVQFASGGSYTLDYSEDVVDVSPTGGSEIYAGFLDEALNMQINMSMFISNKYSSIEEYDKGESVVGYWDSGLPVKQVNINGVDVDYITNVDRQKAIFFIPMVDGYSIRGEYYCWAETGIMTYSPEEVLTFMLGGDIELVAGAASVKATVDYGYQTPDSLGTAVEELKFSVDSNNYQFPVPVYAFLQNGWQIPSFFTVNTPHILAGERVEAALEKDGSIIYDVVLYNPTEDTIAIEDGLVVDMLIARDSNVELQLAESIKFGSDMGQVAGTTDFEPAQNGDYTSYLWYREEDGANISVFFGSDGRIEYFRFMGY